VAIPGLLASSLQDFSEDAAPEDEGLEGIARSPFFDAGFITGECEMLHQHEPPSTNLQSYHQHCNTLTFRNGCEMKILLLQKRGLGNQLFQYAAGLFFARKYGASLEIIREPDREAVAFGHPRPFLLSNFCISAPVREFTLWDRLMCSIAPIKRPIAALARLASRTAVYGHPILEDRTFLAELPIPQSTKTVYLEGNFQAYQYAQTVEQTVRAEFQLCEPPSGKNLDSLEQIRAAETAVSIHIRRGDYAVWGGGPRVLSLDYYSQAMRTIIEKTHKPTFFVFSDDIPFAREALPKLIKGERMVFVDHNGEENAHEDLRLMSACCHNIIANSTLSWWGAWLNTNVSKLVCAPAGWGLANPEEKLPDILPPTWLRIAADIASV
jgi:hypothetical protein